MCAPNRHAIVKLTPVIADHFLGPTLIAACSYQPSIHVSILQPSFFFLKNSLLPLHSSSPHLALITACSYQSFNPCVKITAFFLYIQPSKPAPRLQSASITLTPQSTCQDYSLLPLHSLLNPQPSPNSSLLISTLNPCVKITVCFHYTHSSILI